jgi:DNA replication protein DnaC
LGLTETHPKVEKLSRWGEWFIRRSCLNVRDKGTWLVISGPTGVGKTHVGEVAVRFFNDWAVDLCVAGVWKNHRVPTAAFLDWPKAIRRTEENDPEMVLRDALESQVIVIDDAGAEVDRFKSGAGADLLRSFLSDCELKFVLLTTNVPRAEWTEKFGDRVADRLNSAHHHDMTGAPSYRPRLKGAN